MAEDDDRFLARWARRKQQEKDRAPEPPPAAAPGELTAPEPEPKPERELDEAAREKLIAELPDIESLEEGSDFTAFLQDGVPEELRRRALRKLWRLNPVFANLDGLNDYDEDFTDAATVVQGLKTLYQVGKGMVVPEEEKEEEVAEAETAHDQDQDAPAETQPAEQPVSQPEALEAPEATPVETSARDAPEPAPDHAEAPAAPAPRPESGQAAKRRWGRFDEPS